MLQFQAMKVSTDLAVRTRKNIALQEHHDALENASKLFNEFAVTIVVSIAEIEGSEGDHSIVLLYFKNVGVCLFLGNILLGEASC